jgi:DNA repair photolyase
MVYQLITCNSLFKKITSEDVLFNGMYCIDPYQNCEYGCMYCDSSLDDTIYIKTNARTILKKELKQIKKGIIIIGSVNDPYQKAENEYKITRELLKIIKKYNFPCHILTKSNLILRDVDLLSTMQCFVTISMISLDVTISQIFEKNVQSPKKRLQIIKTLIHHGIKSGLAVMPVLPFLIESELEEIVKITKQTKAQYLLHKHLELKGDQKKVFLNIIKKYYPQLLSKYNQLYREGYNPDDNYIEKLNDKMFQLCSKYNVSQKMNQ